MRTVGIDTIAQMESAVLAVSAASWSAVAAWTTVVVAASAASAAFVQIRELRRSREEESWPYVVVFMEPTGATPQIVDLVVKNLGKTAAHNISIQFEPPLQRSVQGSQVEDVWIFDTLPVLVPNQEWRTLWDFAPNRLDTDLPDKYEATVSYESSRRRLPDLRFALDWSTYKGRRYVTTYTVHDVAKALREINKDIHRWRESIHGGLSVYVRDADKKDAERRAEIERAMAEQRLDRERVERESRPGEPDPDPDQNSPDDLDPVHEE